MVWKARLVSVDGHAVVKKMWFPDANAPKSLQEMCLKGPAVRPRAPAFDKDSERKKKKKGGRTIYDVARGRQKAPPQVPPPPPPLPIYVYNPITTDYSYMRYAMSLGVGSDIWGGDDSDRSHPPELVHSRESSPASSSSSMSAASPSSSTGGDFNFGRFASLPRVASSSTSGSSHRSGPSSFSTTSTSHGEIYDINMADPRLVASDFTYYESIHFPTEHFLPETENERERERLSVQFEEIRESLVDPFTNTERYGPGVFF